jgi:hypothetical protein
MTFTFGAPTRGLAGTPNFPPGTSPGELAGDILLPDLHPENPIADLARASRDGARTGSTTTAAWPRAAAAWPRLAESRSARPSSLLWPVVVPMLVLTGFAALMIARAAASPGPSHANTTPPDNGPPAG